MRITNDGQFTNLFNRKDISFPMNDVSKPKADYSVNMPKLTSQSWVTVKNRSKGQPLKDTGNYRVVHFGNVWIDKPEKQTKSDSIIAIENTIKVLKRRYDRLDDVFERAKLSMAISKLNEKLRIAKQKSQPKKKMVETLRKRTEKIVADLPKSDKTIRHQFVGGVYKPMEILNLKKAV